MARLEDVERPAAPVFAFRDIANLQKDCKTTTSPWRGSVQLEPDTEVAEDRQRAPSHPEDL